MGPARTPPSTPLAPLVKHSLRSTFATLLAALALAGAGLGAGGSDAARAGPSPVLQQGGLSVDVERALALAFLQGGSPLLSGQAQRPGTSPRVEPGTQPPGTAPFAADHALRRSASGTNLHPTLRPPFARRLAATRDGTLSALSNGVPPPALA